MNKNDPVDSKIIPLEDQGINKNQWNERLATYEPGFKGVITERDNPHFEYKSEMQKRYKDPVVAKKKYSLPEDVNYV